MKLTFTKKEAEKFRSENFDPYFRSDADTDHWRKTHERQHIEAYSRRQLFWLLDHERLPGYELVIEG